MMKTEKSGFVNFLLGKPRQISDERMFMIYKERSYGQICEEIRFPKFVNILANTYSPQRLNFVFSNLP